MHVSVLKSFGSELEKLSVSAATTLSLLQQRAAQGARIAPALMQRAETAAAQGLTHTPAAVRQTALGAGESVRLQQATNQALQNPVTQAMQQRVHGAIQAEAAGAATRTGQPLSKGYEGYMTSSQRAYSPEHMGQVLGSAPVHLPVGETHYMKQLGTSGTLPNGTMPVRGAVDPTAATMVSQVSPSSGVRPRGGAEAGTAVSPISRRAL